MKEPEAHRQLVENLRLAIDQRDRLREENASLVDRHNRESHGTASHEAMAYDQLKAELARLRENYDTVFKDWKDAEVHAARLRERVHGYEEQVRGLLRAEYQRDTLLAALWNLLDDTQHDEHHCTDPVCPVRIARAAIEEADNG